mmetsp:Transcript_62628/g.91824  ORF Transcript_62628/g.91824 Transcript_62628/m.91824 type:complete len:201 (-) Transcript_62628:240-842(-)
MCCSVLQCVAVCTLKCIIRESTHSSTVHHRWARTHASPRRSAFPAKAPGPPSCSSDAWLCSSTQSFLVMPSSSKKRWLGAGMANALSCPFASHTCASRANAFCSSSLSCSSSAACSSRTHSQGEASSSWLLPAAAPPFKNWCASATKLACSLSCGAPSTGLFCWPRNECASRMNSCSSCSACCASDSLDISPACCACSAI